MNGDISGCGVGHSRRRGTRVHDHSDTGAYVLTDGQKYVNIQRDVSATNITTIKHDLPFARLCRFAEQVVSTCCALKLTTVHHKTTQKAKISYRLHFFTVTITNVHRCALDWNFGVHARWSQQQCRRHPPRRKTKAEGPSEITKNYN